MSDFPWNKFEAAPSLRDAARRLPTYIEVEFEDGRTKVVGCPGCAPLSMANAVRWRKTEKSRELGTR